MRIIPRSPMSVDIYADGATTFTLPSAPSPWPSGFGFRMIDSNGTFSSANMVVSGPIDGGTSVTLSTAYQIREFVWSGTGWV